MNSENLDFQKNIILESIEKSFFLIFQVNLKNGIIEIISENTDYPIFNLDLFNHINEFVSNNPNIEKAYAENLVKNFNLTSLQHAYKTNKKKIEMICEYKINDKITFVAIEVSFKKYDDSLAYAIFTLKDIDRFVVRQQKSRDIFGSLSKIYTEIFYLNLDTGTIDKVLNGVDHIISLETSTNYETTAINFCNSFVHINDRNEFRKRFCSLKQMKKYYKKQNTESIEIRKINPDNSDYTWVRVTAVPIDTNPVENTKPSTIIVFEDITSLKKQTEIKAFESMLLTNAISLAYDSIVAINISKDTYYGILENVPDGDKLTGHKKFSKIVKRFSEDVLPEYKEEFLWIQNLQYLKQQFKNGTKSIYYEFQKRLVDNKIHWLSLQLLLMQDPFSKDITCINLAHQIDKTREQEAKSKQALSDALYRAEEASKAKTEFLSRMSHDIRTPMNGIIGFLEIIKRYRNDQERVDDCLGKINIASRHLLSLINDVLNMNKLDSGKINLLLEPFNLYNLVKSCCIIVEGQISDETSLELITDISDFEHANLIGSELQIQQVLINILGNAIKYNKPGGKINFSVKEIQSTEETATIEFIISDTGIGMTTEYVAHIFEPFSREDTSVNSSYTGSGLGMSIVKKLVDLMNGTIAIETEKGVGSSFRITIPFKINHSSVVDEEAEINKLADLNGKKVLLVEDNLLNQQITEFMLKEMNAEVEIAENGKIAIEKFVNNPPNTYSVILMDLMMPVMGGLEATINIRNSNKPDAKTVPIIAMTANTFSDDIKHCMDIGMNAHIGKPIEIMHVSNVLRHFAR